MRCGIASAGLLVVFSACGGSAGSRETTPGPAMLRIAIRDDLQSLDPNRVVDSISESVLFNVFEPLVGFDDKLGIRTLLAESWEQPQPERWRFRLRRGVRFHDGTAVTAPLVREALLAVRGATESEASEFLSHVSQIVAVDELTLDLVTLGARVLLPSLPAVFVAKPNAAGPFPPLVGTGPYRILRFNPAGEVELERAPGYRGPAPEFARVAFVSVEHPGQRVGLLQGGLADIVYEVPPRLAGALPESARLVRAPGVSLFYLGLDLRRRAGNALRDVRVRRALHLAIDRQRIVDEALVGMAVAVGQPAPPRVLGFDAALAPPRADPPAARALLDEAGVPRGLALSIDVSAENAPAARLVTEDWMAIGLTASVRELARQQVYERAESGDSQAFFVGWTFSSGEAGEFLEYCLHTPTGRLGFNNLGWYSSRALDALAERIPTLLDLGERQEQLRRAMRLAIEELPVLPLYAPDDLYGVRRGLRFRPRADGVIWLPDVRSEGP